MRSARVRSPSWAVAALQASFTTLWSTAFRVGRAARTPCVAWSPEGGHRVVVVAPHPDDEVVGCGGAIMRHVAAGDDVSVVFVTDGRRSRAFGLGPDQMAARRRAEAHDAARVLGVAHVVWLGFPEGGWQALDLEPRLDGFLAGLSPDIVYAPSRVDFHPEHHRVAHALGRALAVVPAGSRVRVFQVQVPLTSVLVNGVVSVGRHADAHAAALAAHATQYGSIARCVRLKRYAARAHRLDGLVEEFWEMPAPTYRDLHADPPERWTAAGFRGVRYGAWGDPLSYLAGSRERHRLRRIASGGGS